MTREELEKMFDEYFEWKDEIEIINNIYIKQFIFETIIPEVLKSILLNEKHTDDNSEFDWWYNRCIDDIKQKAKELYWITL